MRKQFLSVLLCLSILLSLIPAVSAVSHPFTDVPDGKWYTEHIQYVYERGLMNGTSGTTFAPDETMTRAMAVTVLHRLAGSPAQANSNPFADVPSGKWYTNAVVWAVASGVTTGTTDTAFEPNSEVTREQLVAFLYRYAAYIDWSLVTDHTADLSGYADQDTVSKFAREPFGWAVANGIITGTDATHLSPKGSATRAQCATILSRFDKWMNGEDIGSEVPTDPGHEHDYIKIMTRDPSCEEAAYDLYFCYGCGDSYKVDGDPALGHDYVGTESEGRIDYVCTRCGDAYWESTVVIDDEFEAEVAKYVAQYINQFRNEQGSGTCEWLPGMAQVADYRADQLITNFAHDTKDIREAHAYYEYGEYIDMTLYGGTEEDNYWESHGHEAIAKGGATNDYDAEGVGKKFAENLHNSAPHWAYLGDNTYTYISVGVEYVAGELPNMGRWYICVMVNTRNYG